MFLKLNKKGQGTLEYAVIIAVVVGALLAMQVYVKRAVQGRLRQASNDIGDQFSTAGRFETIASSDSTTDETSAPVSRIAPGAIDADLLSSTTTDVIATQTVTEQGHVAGGGSPNEFWGN